MRIHALALTMLFLTGCGAVTMPMSLPVQAPQSRMLSTAKTIPNLENLTITAKQQTGKGIEVTGYVNRSLYVTTTVAYGKQGNEFFIETREFPKPGDGKRALTKAEAKVIAAAARKALQSMTKRQDDPMVLVHFVKELEAFAK